MSSDPFEPGNVSSLGTFRGAYYDDDATEIGSDDLSARPRIQPCQQPQNASATWIAVVVIIVAIPVLLLAGWLLSLFQ
ncbi:MAG TPA: hypothetical protein VMV82_06100 [Candidatus Dormibacteraeota bacterium]|nr:hypothetical protein [Candidatus Dormibacteraeota bacterium]